jgi:hypothetical protein
LTTIPPLRYTSPSKSALRRSNLRSASRAQRLLSREPSAANSRARVTTKEGQNMLSPALGHYGRLTTSYSCALALPFNLGLLKPVLSALGALCGDSSLFSPARQIFGGPLATFSSHFANFLVPFFSAAYAFLFPQVPCFHIHRKYPGGTPLLQSQRKPQ